MKITYRLGLAFVLVVVGCGGTSQGDSEISETAQSVVATPKVRATSSSTASATSTLTLAKPPGTTVGDLLVAFVANQVPTGGVASKMTAPAGWTAISGTQLAVPSGLHGGVQHQAFFKVAGGGEPATYAFAQTNGARYQMAGGLYDIIGANAAHPIDASAATANGAASTACGTPSVSTTSANALLLFSCALATNAALTATPPAGMTAGWEQVNSAGSYRVGVETASQTQSAIGPSGARSATLSLASVTVGTLVAIAGSPGTGGGSDAGTGDGGSDAGAGGGGSDAGGGSTGASSATCSPSPCTAGTETAQTVSAYDSDGADKKLVTRTYWIDRPNNLTGVAPLVVDLDTTSGGFHALAPTNRFVVVRIDPTIHSGQNATPTTDPVQTRAAFLLNCGTSGTSVCDDAPMVKAILDKIDCIGASPCQNIDPHKVYMAGTSKGGNWVLDLACNATTSAYFTAGVAVTASPSLASPSGSNDQTARAYCPAILGSSNGTGGGTGLSPNLHLSLGFFFGDNDGTGCTGTGTPPDCRNTGYTDSNGRWRYSDPQIAGDSNPPSPATVAGTNVMIGHTLGCSGTPAIQSTYGTTNKLHKKIYRGCTDSKRAMETVLVNTGGHAWAGVTRDGFDPYAEAWTFFSSYGG